MTAISRQTLSVKNRQRYFRAVRRTSVKPFRSIVGRIEAAQNLFTLQQRALPSGHVIVVNGERCLHRSVFKPQRRGVQFQIRSQTGAVSGLVESQIMVDLPRPGNDANLRQPARPFFKHDIVFKQLEIGEVNIISMSNDLVPMFPLWLRYWRPHKAKVFRAIVGPDDKSVFDMLDVILMLSLAREKNLKSSLRIVGIEVSVFLAERLSGNNQQKFLRLRFEDIGDEALVILLKNQLILCRIGSHHVPINLILSQRDFVLLAVEKRTVVV